MSKVDMKFNSFEKQRLIDVYVSDKDTRTDIVLVANTKTIMGFSSLNHCLSLLSASVNGHFIKGKWWKKKNERIVFDCWNQKSKGTGHSHSHIFLKLPPNLYDFSTVILRTQCAWATIGIKKGHRNFSLYKKYKNYGSEERIVSYSIRDFTDDVSKSFKNIYSRFDESNHNYF